jgi:RNA polymerase sigma-70 factor, ECF subfamily
MSGEHVDDDLVRAAADGDRAAAARLFEAIKPHVRRMIARRISTSAKARDVLDELEHVVTAALALSLDRLTTKTVAGLNAYLSGIVTHKVGDWIEARRGRHAVASLDSQVTNGSEVADRGDFLLASQTTPSAAAARNERLADVMRVIDSMGRSEREILLLAYVDQLDTAALAAHLKTTREAAAMRLLRATRELRGKLPAEPAERRDATGA